MVEGVREVIRRGAEDRQHRGGGCIHGLLFLCAGIAAWTGHLAWARLMRRGRIDVDNRRLTWKDAPAPFPRKHESSAACMRPARH